MTPLNRLEQEKWKDALGITVKTIDYDWDANDNLLLISDGVTTYTNEFDQLNRLIEQDGVWGTTLTFGWNAADRRTSVTDNFHGVVASTFDDVNRLTTPNKHPLAGHAVEIRRMNYVIQSAGPIDFRVNAGVPSPVVRKRKQNVGSFFGGIGRMKASRQYKKAS